jgi:hypothetical protein
MCRSNYSHTNKLIFPYFLITVIGDNSIIVSKNPTSASVSLPNPPT